MEAARGPMGAGAGPRGRADPFSGAEPGTRSVPHLPQAHENGGNRLHSR